MLLKMKKTNHLSAFFGLLKGFLKIHLSLTRTKIAIPISIVVLIITSYYALSNSIEYSYRSVTFLALHPIFNQAFFDQIILVVGAGIALLLSFDWIHRLKANRINEVVYSTPISNFYLVLSQFLCSFLITYMVVVFIAVTARILPYLLVFPFMDVIHILDDKLLRFLFYDAVTYLFLIASITLTCSVVFKNRIFVLIIPLGFMLLYFVLLFELPLFIQLIIAPVGSNFGSSNPVELLNGLVKLIFIGCSCLLLIMSSVTLDRSDQFSKQIFSLQSAFLGFFVVASLIYLVLEYSKAIWIEDPFNNLGADERGNLDGVLESIVSDFSLNADGTVVIESAYSVHACGQIMRFRVNPELVVESTEIDNIDTVWVQSRDIVSIDVREEQGNCNHSVRMVVSGEIDGDYALSSDMERIGTSSLRETDGHLHGYRWSSMNSDFMGLMPQSAWLPLPMFRGPQEKGFALDLKVSVPTGFVPVSVGNRSEIGIQSENNNYRFTSEGNRDIVPLIAAPYAVSSVSFPHVNVHFLYNIKHRQNYENLTRLLKKDDLLRTQLGLFPDSLFRSLGPKEQPFEFYFVEVPSYLRTHQLDPEYRSFESFPGLYLHKEFGYGSAIFRQPENNGEVDQADFDTDQHWEYFGSYFLGEDLLYAVSSTIVDDLLRSNGYENQHLETLLVGLGKRALSQLSRFGSTQSYSPYVLEYPELYTQSSVLSLFKRYMGMDRSYVNSTYVLSRGESVWDSLELNRTRDVRLDDSLSSANLFAVMNLRNSTTVDLINDQFGRRQLIDILARLSRTDDSKPLGIDRLIKNAYEYDEDLGEILDSWANEIDLPGFLVSEVQLRMNQHSDGSEQAYSYEFSVKNDEPTSGWVRFNYVLDMPTFSFTKFGFEGPTKVEGNGETRFKISTEYPLQSIYVDYYLSKNRSRYKGIVLPTSSTPVRGDNKPVYTYDLYSSSLIVDDLDQNFQFISAGSVDCEGRNTAFESQNLVADTRGCWSRRASQSALGKYRNTFVRTLAANGRAHAYFDFDVPVCSKWELSYFVPAKRFPVLATFDLTMIFPASSLYFELGTVEMEIMYGDRVLPMKFDAAEMSLGWNVVDQLELPTTGGNLRVSISDQTDGDLVIADAIKLDCVVP